MVERLAGGRRVKLCGYPLRLSKDASSWGTAKEESCSVATLAAGAQVVADDRESVRTCTRERPIQDWKIGRAPASQVASEAARDFAERRNTELGRGVQGVGG